MSRRNLLLLLVFLFVYECSSLTNTTSNDNTTTSVIKDTNDTRTISWGGGIVGFVVITFSLMIAAAGGVGGGGILVPMFILCWNYSTKAAIPLSNVTIFGGAVANYLIQYSARHPFTNRPLIDYDMALMMEPLTIIGSITGALLNTLLPSYVISVSLVILLSWTCIRTGRKWKNLENDQQHPVDDRSSVMTDQSVLTTATTSMILYDTKTPRSSFSASATEADAAELASYGTFYPHANLRQKLQLAQLLEDESCQVPVLKVLTLVWIEAGVVLIYKGFGGGSTIIPREYAYVSTFGWILIHFLIIRSYLLRQYRQKLRWGYNFAQGDIRWNVNNTLVFPSICTVAGVCAGLFGIGGGIIKGPLMLEMGVLPPVAATTSSFMILFTTASAVSVYAYSGLLNTPVAYYVFALGFFCTYIGQMCFAMYMKHRNVREGSGTIVLLIFIILCLSTILMGYESINTTIREFYSISIK